MSSTKGKKDKDQSGQDAAADMRRTVANAYAFVKGQEATQSFNAVTFEDLMDQQIEVLTGDPKNGRPNALDRIKKAASELKVMAEKIKLTDPSFFDAPDKEKDTSTPV